MLKFAKAGAILRAPRDGELYLAGESVPAGTYIQIETHSEVVIETGGCLPGSLDGRVACYEPAPVRWKQHRESS